MDKKLNQVSTLTDFDYALVVKGNDVAKVSKQQLAEVLGGLLGIDSSWFRYRRVVTNTDDFNDMTVPGMYGMIETASSPNSPGFDYGILNVFSANGFVVQQAWDILTVNSKVRTRRETMEWQNWV